MFRLWFLMVVGGFGGFGWWSPGAPLYQLILLVARGSDAFVCLLWFLVVLFDLGGFAVCLCFCWWSWWFWWFLVGLPWGTPYHQILMVLVVFGFGGFLWFLVVLLVLGMVIWSTHYPPRFAGLPLSFPLTFVRFSPLLGLVVFGGFGVSPEVFDGCWWFWWFWVVLSWGPLYQLILLVARGSDGFVFCF